MEYETGSVTTESASLSLGDTSEILDRWRRVSSDNACVEAMGGRTLSGVWQRGMEGSRVGKVGVRRSAEENGKEGVEGREVLVFH